MIKQIGLLYYIRIPGIFLMLAYLLISKADYSNFSTTILNTYHRFKTDSHKECHKTYLEENNKTPIKCNSNYCYNFSSFFTASFPCFRFGKLIDQDIENCFFLYDDLRYSSFFNSIWIPPKIKI